MMLVKPPVIVLCRLAHPLSSHVGQVVSFRRKAYGLSTSQK